MTEKSRACVSSSALLKKGAVMRPSQVETYTDEGKAASKEDDESDTEL